MAEDILASAFDDYSLTARHVAKLAPGVGIKDVKNWTDRGLLPWQGRRSGSYLKRSYSFRSVVVAFALHMMRQAAAPLDPVGVKMGKIMWDRFQEHSDHAPALLDREPRHYRLFVYQIGLEDEDWAIAGHYVAGNMTLHELGAYTPFLPPKDEPSLFNVRWDVRVFPIDRMLAFLVADFLRFTGACEVQVDEVGTVTLAGED